MRDAQTMPTSSDEAASRATSHQWGATVRPNTGFGTIAVGTAMATKATAPTTRAAAHQHEPIPSSARQAGAPDSGLAVTATVPSGARGRGGAATVAAYPWGISPHRGRSGPRAGPARSLR